MKIGVVIDHVQNMASGVIPAYTEIRDQAQAAEASGFDSIWFFDHLMFRQNQGIWECWTLLCALAEATNRVELGTLVLCNPFRNPALLAKMAHTLDEVSSGRLILGVGAGWHKPEFDAFGFPFERRVDRFEEALQILNPLLGGERVDFAGTHYQVQNCAITPSGPRSKIPLMVGAKGPRMLRLVARYADQWNTAWPGNPKEMPERLELIRNACVDVGRDPATLTVTVGVPVAFPDFGAIDGLNGEPLTGSAEELAQAYRGFKQAGADHLILWVSPAGPSSMERLTESVRLYRDDAG